jgi:hypothetical protein
MDFKELITFAQTWELVSESVKANVEDFVWDENIEYLDPVWLEDFFQKVIDGLPGTDIAREAESWIARIRDIWPEEF